MSLYSPSQLFGIIIPELINLYIHIVLKIYETHFSWPYLPFSLFIKFQRGGVHLIEPENIFTC